MRNWLPISLLRAFVLLFGLTIPAFVARAGTTYENPLASGTTISGMITNVIGFLLTLAAPLALLALILGGMILIFGGVGNERQAILGKRIILWAIIGLAVVGLAAVILALISYSILGIESVSPNPAP